MGGTRALLTNPFIPNNNMSASSLLRTFSSCFPPRLPLCDVIFLLFFLSLYYLSRHILLPLPFLYFFPLISSPRPLSTLLPHARRRSPHEHIFQLVQTPGREGVGVSRSRAEGAAATAVEAAVPHHHQGLSEKDRDAPVTFFGIYLKSYFSSVFVQTLV